ncbi:cation:proton antiporter [Parasphingorhabdus sp.]|uniref:cation:proton antiporter n=1 Tax=Parasphingorhabdus sp. TaxID=2709688 RepID=UPI003593C050
MHEGVWLTILGLFGLLTIAVIMLPISRPARIPYTVFLAIIGILLGFGLGFLQARNFGIISDLFHAFGSFALTSEIIFFIFLPALVFESALAIDVRRLFADIGPIMFLAVAGLLISAFMVGGAVWASSAMPFVVCLLLGAILSATDPVAVVAIFKDLGAPKRLAVLVEGESLFNDATAIVLFNILAAMILSQADTTVLGGISDFLVVFSGGVLVGLVMARMFTWIISHVQKIALVEVTLTISLAYLSFLIAEHYLHVSGVMATVTAALVMGSYGRTSISSGGWHLLKETWENLGFWANSLIFVLVGMAVPEIMSFMSMDLATVLGVALFTAFLARGILTHLLLPIMSKLHLSVPVSNGFRTVMWWGGLRGAVSLALALAIYENTAFPVEVREFIVVLVCGFVLFTLFINAPTVGVVMRLFDLDKLSPSDLAIRNRAIGRVLQSIAANVPAFAANHRIDDEVANSVVDTYQERFEANHALRSAEDQLSQEDWMKIGLLAALGQERRGYLDHYASGHITPAIARELLSINDEMLDQTKANGVQGWKTSHHRCLLFNRQFHFALQMQRRIGFGRPLRNHVANRFERLRTIRMVALEVRDSLVEEIEGLVEKPIVERLIGLVEKRINQTETAVAAIRLQYPAYAKDLEQRYLERCAIRQERASYKQMQDEAIIGGEVYSSLEDELDMRYEKLSVQPVLDLGLAPIDLVAKVPLFSSLTDDQRLSLAKLLRPELSIPDEKIISKGDAGDCMYFVSSGALSVEIEPEAIIIGTGGFVGEMALVNEEPRSANVRSIGFSDLLTLHKRDFVTFLEINTVLKDVIESVASERTQSNFSS